MVNAPADVVSLSYEMLSFRLTPAFVGIWGQVGSYRVIPSPIDWLVEVCTFHSNTGRF